MLDKTVHQLKNVIFPFCESRSEFSALVVIASGAKLDYLLREVHEDILRTGARLFRMQKRIVFPNGSTIQFKVCSSERDLENLRGVGPKIISIDETIPGYIQDGINAYVRVTE